MTQRKILLKGQSASKMALATACLALLVFGGVASLIFFGPGVLTLWRIVWGSLFAAIGVVLFPWLMLDARYRQHILTDTTMIYKSGILNRYEVEIPYTNIQAVTVKRNLLARFLSCGEVKVAAHGVLSPGLLISSTNMNSICIKAIPDYREVSDFLRAKLDQSDAPVKVEESAAE